MQINTSISSIRLGSIKLGFASRNGSINTLIETENLVLVNWFSDKQFHTVAKY